MSNVLNKMFDFYGTNEECFYSYSFTNRVYKGHFLGLCAKMVRDHPSLWQQIEVLALNQIAFFYDPLNKILRFIPKIKCDETTIAKAIISYTSNISKDLDKMNKFCSENNISDFILSNNYEKLLQQITDYLDSKDVKIELT